MKKCPFCGRENEAGSPCGCMEEGTARPSIPRRLEIAVIVAALATIPLSLAAEIGLPHEVVLVGDWCIWVVFVVEYAMLMRVAQDRARFVVTHWIHIVVIVLTFPLLSMVLTLAGLARTIRLTRLVRLLRFLRIVAVSGMALRGLRTVFGRPGVLYLCVLSIFLVFGCSAAITVLEPETVKGNMGDALWWAIVTATTVGYGDISPQTFGGRIVAVLLMVTGIGLISTISAAIAAHFVGQDKLHESQLLMEQLNTISARLDQIVAKNERCRLDPVGEAR